LIQYQGALWGGLTFCLPLSNANLEASPCGQAANAGTLRLRVDIPLTPEWRLHMAKGYWIGRVDVKNEEGFKPYATANAGIFNKFGGRYLIRSGKFEAMEGNSRARNVVVEFPDYASALACYRSPEYQENIKVRLPRNSRSNRHRGLRRSVALSVGPRLCPPAASRRPGPSMRRTPPASS
jgi:uncharacterized protein (DUF1330 family)